jgi:hypothetical protein
VAREINWDEPLSPEDREWAEQRPDMPAGNGMTVAQRLAQLDSEYGYEDGKSPEKRIEELRSTIATAQNELERLEREQMEFGNPNKGTVGDPASGLVVDNTPVDGQAPEGAPNVRQDYSDQHYWTVARLKEEIETRNPDREQAGLEPLSTAGKRTDLVERLVQDDRDIEAQGE